VYLQECVIGDQDIAKLVHSMLEYTVLCDIAILTEIHYDPDFRNSVVPKDVEFVKDYYEMSNESEADLLRLSRYVLLIELDQKMCYDKKIQMNKIVREIQAVYGQDLNAIVTDDNAEDLVVRVGIINDVPSDPRAYEEGNAVPMEEES
jgi:DNA-directed RNA polymerase II subunit RPB1